MPRTPWTALVALVGLLLALGCGGYSIKIEPPEASTTEVVTETAPAPVPVPGVAPTPTAPRPAPKPGTVPAPVPGPKPVPAPAPVPSHRGVGQIQVTTAAAVQAVVDGVPVAFSTEQGYVVDVSSGAHELEIYNLVGALAASQSVDVPSGKRVRFSYKPKTLTQLATVEASALPAPEPVYIPPAPVPVAPGSCEITNLASIDAVFVDGYSARYDARTTSFISSGLTPGSHDLRVEVDGAVVYTGPVDIESGQNHRCLTSWNGYAWTLDCHWTRPNL